MEYGVTVYLERGSCAHLRRRSMLWWKNTLHLAPLLVLGLSAHELTGYSGSSSSSRTRGREETSVGRSIVEEAGWASAAAGAIGACRGSFSGACASRSLNRDKIDIDFNAFYSDELVEEVRSRIDSCLQSGEGFDVGYSGSFEIDREVDGANSYISIDTQADVQVDAQVRCELSDGSNFDGRSSSLDESDNSKDVGVHVWTLHYWTLCCRG